MNSNCTSQKSVIKDSRLRKLERNEERRLRKVAGKLQKNPGRTPKKRGKSRESRVLRQIQQDPNAYGRWMQETRSAVLDGAPEVGIDNTYLRMILDPIGCKPVGFPDSYNGFTSTFKAISNLDLPYLLSAVTSGGATVNAGYYHAAIVPDLINPLRYLHYAAFNADYSSTFTSNSLRNFLTPLRSISSLSQSPVVPSNKDLLFNPNQVYSVYATYDTNVASLAPEQWSFHGADTPTGTEFFGIPGDAMAFQVTVQVASPGGATFFNVTPRSTTGAGATVQVAVVAAGTYTVTTAGVNASVMPGVGVELSFTNPTANDVFVSAISITARSGAGSKFAWHSQPIKDASFANQLFQQYRVVSQGALLSWRGPTIADGGRAAGYLYRGGLSPGAMSFYDYGTLSSLQGSSDNALKLGTYGIFEPMDTKAMAFRSVSAPVDNFPYLSLTGQYSGDGTGSALTAGVLRLRVGTNYECVSVSQVVSQKRGRIDMGERAATVKYLADFPMVMENPLHWGMVADALRGALKGTFQTAKGAMDFYDKHKSWLVPVGQALATAALAL